MTTKNLKRRLERVEQRMRIPLPVESTDASSHSDLLHELHLSRQILDAEREALHLLRQLGPLLAPARGGDCGERIIAEREQDVVECERRCREAGIPEEDIARLAG